jgi:sarcosine oxidase gamma subunit
METMNMAKKNDANNAPANPPTAAELTNTPDAIVASLGAIVGTVEDVKQVVTKDVGLTHTKWLGPSEYTIWLNVANQGVDAKVVFDLTGEYLAGADISEGLHKYAAQFPGVVKIAPDEVEADG